VKRLAFAALLAIGVHAIIFTMEAPKLRPKLLAARRARAVTVTLADRPARNAIASPVAKKEPQKHREMRKPMAAGNVKTPKKDKPSEKPEALNKEPLPLSQAAEKADRKPPPDTEPFGDLPGKSGTVSLDDAADETAEATPLNPPSMQEEGQASTGREARPLYSRNEPPRYPRLARKRGYEGMVMLNVFVTENGRVNGVKVDSTSGYSILDRAAMDAVNKWTFEPGIRNGLPAGMWVKVPVRFNLTE